MQGFAASQNAFINPEQAVVVQAVTNIRGIFAQPKIRIRLLTRAGAGQQSEISIGWRNGN